MKTDAQSTKLEDMSDEALLSAYGLSPDPVIREFADRLSDITNLLEDIQKLAEKVGQAAQDQERHLSRIERQFTE